MAKKITSYEAFKRAKQKESVKAINSAKRTRAAANLKRTDRVTSQGIGVVSADSLADVIYRCENHEEAVKLMETDMDNRNQTTNFKDLFNV